MRHHPPFLPAYALSILLTSGLTAQTLTTDFINAGYTITDLGSITDLPVPYGGLTIRAASPDTLYIGGAANQAGAAVHKVPLVRDAVTQRITGFAGPAVPHAPAPNIDGGLSFAPNGTMLYTRYSMNELGQLLADNTVLSIPLTPLGVGSSVGSHVLVPAGSPGAGNLIVASYNASNLYKVPYIIAPDGSYQLAAATASASMTGIATGPEGVAYVPNGSAGFTSPSMVVSAYGLGKIVAFEVDADGLPITTTARDMITSMSGAEGAMIDPLTGDFLFSTFSGSNRVILVSGFEAPSAVADVAFAAAPLLVSPNPTDGPVRLSIDARETLETVEVLDVNGRIVLRDGRPDANTIDLTDLGPGLYLVQAHTRQGLRMGRVVRD